jgi:hypothetical protein
LSACGARTALRVRDATIETATDAIMDARVERDTSDDSPGDSLPDLHDAITKSVHEFCATVPSLVMRPPQ